MERFFAVILEQKTENALWPPSSTHLRKRNPKAPTPSSASAARRIWSTASGCSGCCSSTATGWSTSREGADFVVVNTCGFIERAREESYRRRFDEMLELKRRGGTRGVIVSGCLAEREKEALLEELPGDRPPRRRVRPRASDQGRRSAGRRARRAADACFSPAPIAAAVRSRAAADHAAAFRLSENLRRLRPAVHVLRDSQDARQARHQADRRSHRRGQRTGGRRRARADHRRPGHDLLRHGSVRRAAAGRIAARAARRSTGIDWIRLMYLYPMYFTDELIDVIAGEQEDRAVSRHAAAAHQRHDAQADAAPREPRRHRRAARQAAVADSEPGAADDVHHRLPRRNRRAIRGTGRVCPSSKSSSGWACSPIRSNPTRRRPKLPDHLPEEVKNERRDRLMAVQQEIAFDWNERRFGRRLDVLIDRAVPDEKNAWIGRSLCRCAGRRRRGLCHRQKD